MGCENVRFVGFVPVNIVPKYLAASDVLLIPYTNRVEDNTGCIITDFMSPLKMFEYMASGRPIVASKLSVITEVLKDKENALLFEPEDEQDFINAINVTLEDTELAQRIARNAGDEVKKYKWSERTKAILSFSSDRL
jgi:glycosyltransferase involved in cell wall biosynthesis